MPPIPGCGGGAIGATLVHLEFWPVTSDTTGLWSVRVRRVPRRQQAEQLRDESLVCQLD